MQKQLFIFFFCLMGMHTQAQISIDSLLIAQSYFSSDLELSVLAQTLERNYSESILEKAEVLTCVTSDEEKQWLQTGIFFSVTLQAKLNEEQALSIHLNETFPLSTPIKNLNEKHTKATSYRKAVFEHLASLETKKATLILFGWHLQELEFYKQYCEQESRYFCEKVAVDLYSFIPWLEENLYYQKLENQWILDHLKGIKCVARQCNERISKSSGKVISPIPYEDGKILLINSCPEVINIRTEDIFSEGLQSVIDSFRTYLCQ